jgi:hypothetical protein
MFKRFKRLDEFQRLLLKSNLQIFELTKPTKFIELFKLIKPFKPTKPTKPFKLITH